MPGQKLLLEPMLCDFLVYPLIKCTWSGRDVLTRTNESIVRPGTVSLCLNFGNRAAEKERDGSPPEAVDNKKDEAQDDTPGTTEAQDETLPPAGNT